MLSSLPGWVVAGVALSAAGVSASAQFSDEDPAAVAQKRQTLARLMKPMTVELTDHRLEDVVQFIADVTQADITPLWIDDRTGVGLDPEATVTLNAKGVTALQLLEMVLDKVSGEGDSDSATWQFTKYGAFEFGPKERLNKRKRVELYDINDLLMDVPDYDNAPEFDLNTVFQLGGQQGGGGGGGQSPFQDQGTDIDRRDREEKVQDIVDLLVTTVEPEQWVDNGGEAATVREMKGTLFINAPDYVHRQIAGYPWWPSRNQTARSVNGRRYVTLDGSYDFAEAGLTTTSDVKAVP
jgi:hypothetical protein